jgi:predicted ester cyclase
MTPAPSLRDLSVPERVQLFEQQCNAPGLDGYAALLASDVEARMGARTTKGRDAVVGTFAVMKDAFPDLVVTFAHVLFSGDEVAVELIERGTHTGPLVLPGRTIHPTGRQVELRTAAFFRYDSAGLIQSVRDYVDMGSLRQQLGM